MFHERCCSKIDDILQRNRVPIIVGGAGYYLRSLIRGVPTTPNVSRDIEIRIRHMLDVDSSWDKSLKRLEMIDPIYSKTLSRNDYYRLHRALCIFESSGKPVSSFTDMNDTRFKYDWRCIFLSTDRVNLNRVVDRRVESMIEQGLIEEVVNLMLSKKFSDEFTAGKAIGYRETMCFLKRFSNLKNHLSDKIIPWKQMDTLFLEYITELMQNSRHYAKRQWTWFRNEPDYIWIETGKDESTIEPRILEIFQLSNYDYQICLKETMKHSQIIGKDQTLQRKLMKNYTSILSVYNDMKKRISLLEDLFDKDLTPLL